MNETPHTRIDTLVANVLMQRASGEECRALKEWIDQSEENNAYFEQCAEALFAAQVLANSKGSFDASAAFRAFARRIERQSTDQPQAKHGHKLRWVWQTAVAGVAAACVALGFFALGQRVVEGQFQPIVIEPPAGAHLKVTLPDGSLLFLNANSRVSYSQGFGVSDRDLELQGEGYFEAAHNAKLPLRVHTKELTVSVLGTKFCVTNYADRAQAQVSLIEGSVLLSDPQDHTLCALKPDQMATFDKTTRQTTVRAVDATTSIDWIGGELLFNEESLSTIMARLEQTYGVQIIITDPALDTLRFYASFIQAQTSIEHILNALAQTGRVTYTRQGNQIYISAVKK